MFNADQKQVILGTLLGNSWLKPDRKGYRLMMRSTSQSWLKSKEDCLSDLWERTYTKGSFTYSVGKQVPELEPYYQLLYDDEGDKQLTMKVLDQLNLIGMMVWYGDVGCLVGRNNRHACLRTQQFHRQGDIICEYFNSVGIEANINLIRRKKVIVFTRDGTDNLMKIILPVIPKSRFHLIPKPEYM